MKIKVLMFCFLLLTDWNRMACGAEADSRSPALVEGAKKVGKMVFYTSVETEFARSLTAAFEAKYPFIKTDIFRSTHEKVLSRMNVERQTGTFTSDVVSASSRLFTCRDGDSSRRINRRRRQGIRKDSKIPTAIGPIFTTILS